MSQGNLNTYHLARLLHYRRKHPEGRTQHFISKQEGWAGTHFSISRSWCQMECHLFDDDWEQLNNWYDLQSSCYQKVSLCVQCTVRPNNTKTWEFGTEKSLSQGCARRWCSCLKTPKSPPQQKLSAKSFPRKSEGVGLVVADFLVSEPLLLRSG